MDAASPESTQAVLDAIRQTPTISVRDLATATSRSRETARRAVAQLLAEQRITVDRRGTGAGYPTTYRVP